jgi:hypothetical protein
MICDAMSPEFKKANDILLRIIKTNDRTGGIEYTRLAEINKAFKANDPKAAKAAFDKLASSIAKGEKRLQDELNEAKSKLAETTRTFETAKAALAQQKPLAAMFDKFVKAIDAAKTNPKGVLKLNAYADKLKAFGDFSKRIMQIQQMATAKKDIAKQCEMLKKAVETGKAKHAKAMKKAEDDLAKAKDRVAVFKEMDKIRTKKIAEFAKEREDVQKLGAALPESSDGNAEPKSEEEEKKNLVEYLKKLGNIAMEAKDDYDAQREKMRKSHALDPLNHLKNLMLDVIKKARDIADEETIRDLKFIGGGTDIDTALAWLQNIGANNKEIKPLLRKPINFIQKINRLYDESREKKYGGSVPIEVAQRIQRVKNPIMASYYMLHDPKIKTDVVSRLKRIGINDPAFFIRRLRDGYLAFL